MKDKFSRTLHYLSKTNTYYRQSLLLLSCRKTIRAVIRHIALYMLPLIIVIKPDRKKLILLVWIAAFQLIYVVLAELIRIKKRNKSPRPETTICHSPKNNKADITIPTINLDISRMKEISQRLADTDFYLIPDLTINKLSSKIKIPSNELSIYFNQYLQTPFKSYLNTKRIDHSIQLVEKNFNRYTVDYIAQESGFQNRTTYYRAFKKIKGMAPSEYYELHSSKNIV